jgi:hypothetical protein
MITCMHFLYIYYMLRKYILKKERGLKKKKQENTNPDFELRTAKQSPVLGFPRSIE